METLGNETWLAGTWPSKIEAGTCLSLLNGCSMFLFGGFSSRPFLMGEVVTTGKYLGKP